MKKRVSLPRSSIGGGTTGAGHMTIGACGRVGHARLWSRSSIAGNTSSRPTQEQALAAFAIGGHVGHWPPRSLRARSFRGCRDGQEGGRPACERRSRPQFGGIGDGVEGVSGAAPSVEGAPGGRPHLRQVHCFFFFFGRADGRGRWPPRCAPVVELSRGTRAPRQGSVVSNLPGSVGERVGRPSEGVPVQTRSDELVEGER